MYFPFAESPSSLAQSFVRVGSGRASPFNQGWDKAANFERRHSPAGGLYFKIFDDLLIIVRAFVDATVNDYFDSGEEVESLVMLIEFMKKKTPVLPDGLVGDLFADYDTNNTASLKLLVNKILTHTIHQALLHSIDHGYFDSGYVKELNYRVRLDIGDSAPLTDDPKTWIEQNISTEVDRFTRIRLSDTSFLNLGCLNRANSGN